MTKVKMEQPVVSKELAEAFESVKGDCDIYPSEVCDLDNYDGVIPEMENLDVYAFEDLLIDMYSLGYEIEKPKLKYIRLNPESKLVAHNTKWNYLNSYKGTNLYRLSSEGQTAAMQTQFTQKEVDEFLKDEPAGMWIVEEVEDQ